jgi:hypothetical protein
MTAEERINEIANKQTLLQGSVKKAQKSLVAKVFAKLQQVATNPAALSGIFRSFVATEYKEVIGRFVADIISVGRMNGEYFQAVLEGQIPKDYALIKAGADDYLLQRFGLTKAGVPIADGFIDSFIKDASVELEAKKFAYQAISKKGVGLDSFREGLAAIIEGDSTRVGGYERHFNRYAYDSYQQADSILQEQYAVKLELPAAFYSGGLIADSRAFCKERNGKVWTREEIESWELEKWAGKIPDVSVIIQRGGYNCRHHFNYLTAKQALRRREDLYIDDAGNLKVKA